MFIGLTDIEPKISLVQKNNYWFIHLLLSKWDIEMQQQVPETLHYTEKLFFTLILV